MSGTAGGLVTSVLGLTLLQAVVSSDRATGRLGELLVGAGTLVEHLASPAFPAIPDLRRGATPGASPAGSLVPVAAAMPPRLPSIAKA